jgi:hypothetical protein
VFDVSEAPGLRDDLGEKIDRAVALSKIGVPLNELIRQFDLPFSEQSWGDDWWINSSQVPAVLQENGPVEPNAPNPPKEPSKPAGGSDEDPRPKKDETETGILNDPVRERYWRSFVRRIRPLEETLQSKIKRYLFELRKGALSNILGEELSSEQFIAGLDVYNGSLLKGCSPIIQDAMELGSQMVAEEVGVPQYEPDIDAWGTELSARVKGLLKINETIFQYLIDGVEASMGDLEEAGEAVRRTLGLSSNRASVIARTEVGAAISSGRVLAMRQCGVEVHEWLSSRDGVLGCEHYGDGEIITLGQEFRSGQKWPYDLTSGDSMFNCRCVTVPIQNN